VKRFSGWICRGIRPVQAEGAFVTLAMMSAESWNLFFKIQIAVVHGLGVLNAIHAVLRVRTPQAAAGWALALVTFPYFAIPLYWIFGRSKFIGYRRAMSDEGGPLSAIARDAAAATAPHATDLGMGDNFRHWSKTLTTLPATFGNHVELLIDGDATFQAIFAAIESARSYLLAQFFIVNDDALGREFQNRLIKKAKEGVKICFLFDEVGCHALSRRWLRTLRREGVRVEAFHTTRGRGNRFQLNFRNHRKVVVADGREALVGGLNVGDEYVGRGKQFGPWRDTHVRIEGPAVQAVQLAFVEDWHWATGDVPCLNWMPAAAAANQCALVLATGPADEAERCSLTFIRAVNSAQSRLWISSPYFVPDATVLTALQLAALRGVEVRVLLPVRSDHWLPTLSCFSYYESLAWAGIELWRYQPGFMHQKVLLVDDELASVGSINVDYRSFHLNFELAVLVSDQTFARQVKAMLAQDFANSQRVDLADYRRRPWWFKAAVRSARLLSPVQ
jgi:cardiolipin synthase